MAAPSGAAVTRRAILISAGPRSARSFHQHRHDIVSSPGILSLIVLSSGCRRLQRLADVQAGDRRRRTASRDRYLSPAEAAEDGTGNFF